MAEIKAADVAKLRNITGSGMMDCKKALEESNGDFDLAVDILRKKGQKVASKRADNQATEGLTLGKVATDGKFASLVVINCETDFVAINADFVKFGSDVVTLGAEGKIESSEAILASPYNGFTVAEEIINKTGVIGEKVVLSFYGTVKGECTYAYNHPGNKIAAIVAFNQVVDVEVSKSVAMQIAAMGPIAIDKADVAQSIIDKEIEIGKDLAIQEGKPADMAEKIAMGRLNKFYEETTLLNQKFVKDNSKTVRQYLQDINKNLTVVGFQRASLSI